MLMPMLLIVTFLLLFYALYTAQNAIVRYKASVTTERAAFNWGHAGSEFGTGAYADGRYDGLYWRLTDDALLQGLFGWQADESADTLGYPDTEDPGERLTLRKLYPAAEALGTNWRGSIGYERGALSREIRTSAADPGELSPLASLRGSAVASAEASSPVTEPAEWLRTFDLARYYTARAAGQSGGSKPYLDKAGAILSRKSG
ncbi:hypothetical protein [Cohnella sp. JJ-181]|uniref:hypothetical protein n=1 Tax=Cohnella rhizoplanae TaxID=2974897 RepID=UPI00232E49DD|nr:hypothetical protein [Cohnella sp. JJ-181]